MTFPFPQLIITIAGALLLTFTPHDAVAQNPTPPPAQAAPAQNPVIKEAQQLVTAGKFAEALAVYRKVLAADPKRVDAHLGAGRTLDLMGQHADARRHLASAIEAADPDTKDQARTAMAVSYAFESKAADAGTFFEAVFKDRMAAGNPNGAAGTANAMARVYLESGDLANAEKWYRTGYDTSKQIKDLTPAQADLWQMRWLNAQARVAARGGKVPDARQHAAAMKALLDKGENDAERPQYQYLLGYIALEAGENDAAIAELEKGTLTDSFVLGLIARAYEKKGDAAKAAEYYRKVMAATTHSINTAFSQQWARKYLKQ
ncbi:MAG: tetratricopeptide repeat protein [Acidobacteria bacterium]|nr:tetratricopeptide repeat protein [Acidobacteriota bacterium]MCA1649310.1 tetratricopeptide repeat protein [Acidobacteriota bacterium]